MTDFNLLLIFNNKQYYALNSPCFDIAFPTVDCDGNVLCADGIDAECEGFYNDAVSVGIVGVYE